MSAPELQLPAAPLGHTESDRRVTLGRLLDDDPETRREASREALARRWLNPAGNTLVRAVLLDEQAEHSKRIWFGRHLAAAAPTHATFIRERDFTLYLLTRDARARKPLDDWIHVSARQSGVVVRAIGAAPHDWASADLADSARKARRAADLTAALPELQAGSLDELGGWLLLQAVSVGGLRLADISPAAEALCRRGDALQRRTIETYLDAGGRTSAACAKLHIHRTTLYYRLENMPEIVREALDDGMKRSTLHLSLKLMRLWEATGRV